MRVERHLREGFLSRFTEGKHPRDRGGRWRAAQQALESGRRRQAYTQHESSPELDTARSLMRVAHEAFATGDAESAHTLARDAQVQFDRHQRNAHDASYGRRRSDQARRDAGYEAWRRSR